MDVDQRIRLLYSLLQPHAANTQALLERWGQHNPFTVIADDAQAPAQFALLARRLADVPVAEIAALLSAIIAADKAGDPGALNFQQLNEVSARLEEQIRPLLEDIQSFADSRTLLPASLPADLHDALRDEEVRLERDILGARGRMVKDHDLRILRAANVPEETISAIVRDAPGQADVDRLTARREQVRRLLAASASASEFTETMQSVESFTRAASELLHPLLDPVRARELLKFSDPIFERPREA